MKKMLYLITYSILLTTLSETQNAQRQPDFEIDPQFTQRQSKYALHRTLSNDQMKEELMKLFEAARWAPSNHNNQPWVFIYALHGTPGWSTLISTISEKNQRWVKNAGALILVLSNKIYEKKAKPALSHSFDTGMAVANILLQASNNGLVAHPMETHDETTIRPLLGLRDTYAMEVLIAVGEEASAEHHELKELRERDMQVSGRKKIAEFVFENELPADLITSNLPAQ
jgi:nitroreductase